MRRNILIGSNKIRLEAEKNKHIILKIYWLFLNWCCEFPSICSKARIFIAFNQPPVSYNTTTYRNTYTFSSKFFRVHIISRWNMKFVGSCWLINCVLIDFIGEVCSTYIVLFSLNSNYNLYIRIYRKQMSIIITKSINPNQTKSKNSNWAYELLRNLCCNPLHAMNKM